MEEIANTQPEQEPAPPPHNAVTRRHHPKVIIEKDWKEYIGESVLIIFSVVLALILTEVITTIHEDHQTKEIIRGIRQELSENERLEAAQYTYHLQVMKNIDSLLSNAEAEKKFIDKGIIKFDMIAPRGVLLYDLNDVAWQVAKQANIVSKIDITEYSLIAGIYNKQERMLNLEKEIAGIVFTRESRTAADNRVTLILLKDSYAGWAVNQAPDLLNKYHKAIQLLEKY